MKINSRLIKIEKAIKERNPGKHYLISVEQEGTNGLYKYNGKEYKTLEEIAEEYNISVKRILVLQWV